MSEKKLKGWQGWALFGGCMVGVFLLGLLVSALMERRAEVASIFNNRQNPMADSIVARNDSFAVDFPREYETWAMTADTTFKSEFNSSEAIDVLEQRPNMVILWAGYAFSWDYTTPRGHMHAIEDMTRTLRTGAPDKVDDGSNQPGTCWTCKSPDVPRIMQEKGVGEYYKANWAKWGNEIVNPIGCADCHDARTMALHISRPALREAFARMGKDIDKATHQEMRTLVCAQCHVEYYFKDDPNTPEKDQYLTFPWDKGLTVEDIEAYYDETQYADYVHALSKAPILKAQHPGYETTRMGIHGQRGVSCADCHMPYTADGGVKYSDHQVQSPLAKMDRTCLTCHRESEETLRQNVYERQRKVNEIRTLVEDELAKAHIEAKFAWDKGANETEMKPVLDAIRKSQWRWDFAVASHGAAFHAPQEITRILSNALYWAQQSRLLTTKVLAKHGFTGDVPMPDISTKAKAQQYIGLDMADKEAKKAVFMKDIQPKWVQDALKKGKMKSI
ncbi:MAG: ammonia-forming cytochrome c nitrite reductase [Muribaculaceae bacterium]|nr:ammonia-forming cytochrome c nitrite reductase [Muribaculaceae bacterium]